MSESIEKKIAFIKKLKKLSGDLARFKNDSCIDDIKALFLDNMPALNETLTLNELINQLIILSEKNITPSEADEFISLLSGYWLECLLAIGFYIVFFGEHEGYSQLIETQGEYVVGTQHVYIDKQTPLEGLSVTLPSDRYIVAVYDDSGSEFLKVKGNFSLHELIFLNELYRVGRRRVVKDDIAWLLEKHMLLQKKHHVLLPVHELLLARERCFGL